MSQEQQILRILTRLFSGRVCEMLRAKGLVHRGVDGWQDRPQGTAHQAASEGENVSGALPLRNDPVKIESHGCAFRSKSLWNHCFPVSKK